VKSSRFVQPRLVDPLEWARLTVPDLEVYSWHLSALVPPSVFGPVKVWRLRFTAVETVPLSQLLTCINQDGRKCVIPSFSNFTL
jgi:hypothetical protein